jgi:hypothetical protein
LISLETSERELHIPDEIITSVILGCRMPDHNKEEIKAILRGKSSQINLYQAQLKENSFSLEIVEINY